MWQLQGLDPDTFLREYWQQKPLLLRQALPGFTSIISPEELAGLACEAGVHSRLVVEKDAESPWQLTYGPFQESDFTSLPASHYSLLVSECEKWLPELRGLLECFDFIPRWRIDDLMISYAPDQGSVGPHTDEYDVFLIQAAGTRRWSIEDQRRQDPALLPDLDLAIMQHFDPDQSWELEPGDLLYLPPQVPHHGVAVGDGCMTYSVGFRAPTLGDVMDSLMLEAEQHGLTRTRYRDQDLTGLAHPAEIRNEDILNFRSMVYRMLDQSGPIWADVVGRLVSDSTLAEDIQAPAVADFDDAANRLWIRHPDSRIFYQQDADHIRLFYNGDVARLANNAQHLAWVQSVCVNDVIDPGAISEPFSEESSRVFMQLIAANALVEADEDA